MASSTTARLLVTIGVGLLAVAATVFVPSFFNSIYPFVTLGGYTEVNGTVAARSLEKCTFLYCPRDCGSTFSFWDGYRARFDVLFHLPNGSLVNATVLGTSRGAFWNQPSANNLLTQHEIGRTYPVFFDPDMPQRAVWGREYDSCAVIRIVGVSIACAILFATGLIMSICGCCQFARVSGYQRVAQGFDD